MSLICPIILFSIFTIIILSLELGAGKAAINLFLQPLQQKATVSPFSFFAVIDGSASRLVLIGHFSFNFAIGLLFIAAISFIPLLSFLAILTLAITSSKISSAVIDEYL